MIDDLTPRERALLNLVAPAGIIDRNVSPAEIAKKLGRNENWAYFLTVAIPRLKATTRG